jgi:hypothetical protein
MKIVPFPLLRCALGVAATALAAVPPAQAQGRLDARYAVTLAGVPVGKGAWVIDIADNQFTAAASGATSGLLQVFANGKGTGASRGYMVQGNPVPASFGATITSAKKTEEIRMTLASGDVKDFAVSPETPDDPERVPVTDAHFHGVSDPMTGSLLRVPGTGSVLVPQACQRTTPIFDGRMRYNLQFAYKRMEQIKTEKGYEGPVVVCAVYFTPVAGFIPHRTTIKYLAAQREMEVWLAPVANTRVLVPYRISIPTPIGLGVMHATQFVSVALPHSAAVTPKTQ